MRVDVHHYFHYMDGELKGELVAIRSTLNALIHKGNQTMATLDEVIALAQEQATVAAGLQVAIDALQQQVKDALSGANLPPPVQEKVDAAFAAFAANNAALAAALTDGTGPL